MRKSGFIKTALVLAGAFLFAALFPQGARAQFTTVSATVVDPNGIPYANGTMSAVLVPGSSTGYRLSGQPYSGRIGPVTLDSTGHFAANFGDVTLITPGTPQWLITINSNQGGIPSPLGTGAQSFTYTSTGTIISGSSPVIISTQLNALAPKLTNITVGAGSVTSVGGTSPIVATPSPITGAGSLSCPTCVTATGGGSINIVSPQVAFGTGTNAIGGSALFTWADGTNAQGLFDGPPTASLSTNLKNYFFGYQSENVINSWEQSTDSFTGKVGLGIRSQQDKDLPLYGIFTALDATNLPTNAIIGHQTDVFYNVPMAQSNSNLQTAFEDNIEPYGAGTSFGAAGFEGGAANIGTGTVTNIAGFYGSGLQNSGGGTVHNAYDFWGNDVGAAGDTLNAAFKAESQTAGANNWGFFSASANKDHFGALFSGTDNVTAGSLTIANGSAAAHTIFSSAATTTNTIAGFATVPTTNHLVSCVVSGTVCTLTDSGSTTGGFANTALSNLAAVAINTALLPGSSNTIALGATGSRWTNLFSTALNCGIAGTTSCVITGAGSTSGTATITWPAVAGTKDNPFAFSNAVQLPLPTIAGQATLSFVGDNSTGLSGNGNGQLFFTASNTVIEALSTAGVFFNGVPICDDTLGTDCINFSTAANGIIFQPNNHAAAWTMNGSGNFIPVDNTYSLGDATHRASNLFVTAETCGIAGTTSCILSMAGSTSGTATLTAPATAGTRTNPVISSNYFQIGVAGTTSGELLLAGSTSGTATILAPATAGTTTNAVVESNTWQAPSYATATNCAANGTAANPSVAACGSSASGMFSCATNASAGTCQVNTTAVTANSEIMIIQDASDGGAGQLNVTCETTFSLPATSPLLKTKATGASFTINVGTITTNPACFEYTIIN